MRIEPIDSDLFLSVVRPALEQADVQSLCDTVCRNWSPLQLCRLMHEGSSDARRVVCLTLGLVGDMQVSQCLTDALRDDDDQMAKMAEHALWSIWFRAGSPTVTAEFKAALDAMERGHHAAAVEKFHEVIEIDANFAEAFNQCAIAHYMLEQWREALADCEQAAEIIPTHFGAWAGMGHAHVQLGAMEDAASCYRQALKINPRMPAIASALSRIERRFAADTDVPFVSPTITRPIQ